MSDYDDVWEIDDGFPPEAEVAPASSAPPGREPPSPASPLNELVPAPEAAPIVEVLPAPLARGEDPFERIRRIEMEVCEESQKVVRGALRFAEVLDKELAPLKEPPEAWVAQYGLEEATNMFIIAKASCMSAKEAPVGLKIATQTMVGSMAALEKSREVHPVLNLQWIQMVTPAVFEELELTEGKK